MSVLYKICKVSSGTNDLHNRNAPIPFEAFLLYSFYMLFPIKYIRLEFVE